MRAEIKTVGTLVDWLIGNNGATLFAICNLLVIVCQDETDNDLLYTCQKQMYRPISLCGLLVDNGSSQTFVVEGKCNGGS